MQERNFLTETLCLVISWTLGANFPKQYSVPALCHVRRVYKKAMELGTVLNVNSDESLKFIQWKILTYKNY